MLLLFRKRCWISDASMSAPTSLIRLPKHGNRLLISIQVAVLFHKPSFGLGLFAIVLGSMKKPSWLFNEEHYLLIQPKNKLGLSSGAGKHSRCWAMPQEHRLHSFRLPLSIRL